jgi:hypothetical protein
MNTEKERKEGKPHGETPPSKDNASKMNKERKIVAIQLCPSLQDTHAECGIFTQ